LEGFGDAMITIKNYVFEKHIAVGKNTHAINWPVVYLIEDGKSIYIGETNKFSRRMGQHYQNPLKNHLKEVHMITDEDFNKSAIRDIESALIGYFAADNKYKILNHNNGVTNQDYFDRTAYKNKVPQIWEELQKKGIAQRDIFQLENTDLFKYSPYKSLSDDQFSIAHMILADCIKNPESLSFVEGNPGTGKTILAMYLLKILVKSKAKQGLKVALVVPMTSLRTTLQRVARNIEGLKSSNIIGPTQVIKDDYDTLIIDEAHRLMRRKNIISYGTFDNVNNYLGLDKDKGDQLDWIRMSSKHQIFFYDEGQSIKPADIPKEKFLNLKHSTSSTKTIYELTSQHRVRGGNDYINYVDRFLQDNVKDVITFKDYDVKIHTNFKSFNDKMIELNNEHNLVRMVSGYSFKWISKNDTSKYDIIIDGIKKQWNTVARDWVNSPMATKEVGCIHTVQGYDLNYVFLIFGKEIDYNFTTNSITIDKGQYYDIKGKSSITDEKVLKDYIINIYKTLMTRGIKGIHMYSCNKNFEKYLKMYFG